mmetsp:Transcript_14009/g.42298  ORF Transcript_14009/g.42298 Transcript_14009/m.42298 type:complete len:276 (-) Transcript_14009:138-965(-)
MSLTEVAAIAGTRCRSPGPWGVHLPQCSPASPFGALTRVPPLPRQSRWFLRRSAVACAAPARMVRAEGMHEAAAAAAATLLRMAAVMGAGDWSHAIRTAAGDDTARGGAAEAWSGNVCRFLLLLQRPLVPRSPAAGWAQHSVAVRQSRHLTRAGVRPASVTSAAASASRPVVWPPPICLPGPVTLRQTRRSGGRPQCVPPPPCCGLPTPSPLPNQFHRASRLLAAGTERRAPLHASDTPTAPPPSGLQLVRRRGSRQPEWLPIALGPPVSACHPL